MLINKIQKTKS